MSKLIRFAPVLVLAACGSSKGELVDVDGFRKIGDVNAQTSVDNSTFVFGRFDETDEWDAVLDNELTILATDGDDLCSQLEGFEEFPDTPGKSVGSLQLARAGTTVVDTEFSASSGTYFGELPQGALAAGDELDIVLSGSSVVDETLLPGALVRAELPVVTGTFENFQLALTDTITFEPTDADVVRFVFNFEEGGENVTVGCNAKASSGSLDITSLRPRLGAFGSMNVQTATINLVEVSTPNGPAVVLARTTAQTSVGFTNE